MPEKKSPKGETPVVLDAETQFLIWAKENANRLLTVVTILLVLFAGYRGYQWIQEGNRARATAKLIDAINNFNQGLNAADAADQTRFLETAANQAEQLSLEFSGTPVGRRSRLLAGNSTFYLASLTTGTAMSDLYKRAQDYYQQYLDQATDSTERATGHLALGNVFENLLFMTRDLNLATQAMNAYDEAARLVPGSPVAIEARLAKARLIKVQAGRQAEAAKLYEEILESLPEPQSELRAQALVHQGQTLDPEEVTRLMTLGNWTFRAEAEQALRRLQGDIPEAPPEEAGRDEEPADAPSSSALTEP